jgi:hypothetical protein
MVRLLDMHDGDKNKYITLVGKSEGSAYLGAVDIDWRIIKIKLKELESKVVGCIKLFKILPMLWSLSCGYKPSRHKKLENFCVSLSSC